MKFCPKCGSLMVPRRINNTPYFICLRCGYKEEVRRGEAKSYSLKVNIQHTNREKTVVLDENVKMPKVASVTKNVECPKCGNREAYYWIVQTRAADEPPTRIYRCTKCGYTWREYE